MTETRSGYHIGRSWSGHEIEDDCPCEKAPCGLVSQFVPECPEHAPTTSKTLRQRHLAAQCPETAKEIIATLTAPEHPEATNTGGWIDAEDPLADTVSTCGVLLDMALTLHRSTLDNGQVVMLETAVENLETLRLEFEEPEGFDEEDDD